MAMARCVLRATVLLVAMVAFSAASDHRPRDEMGPYANDEEFIRHIHSIINAFRGEVDDRHQAEGNSLVGTKYRALKRNADFINSILALPKGMEEAGR